MNVYEKLPLPRMRTRDAIVGRIINFEENIQELEDRRTDIQDLLDNDACAERQEINDKIGIIEKQINTLLWVIGQRRSP